MDTNFPSLFEIGERVSIKFEGGENDGTEIFGYVRAATFTASKVRYAILVKMGRPEGALSPEQMEAKLAEEEMPDSEPECCFTLHNIDSCLVHATDGSVIELGADNYS